MGKPKRNRRAGEREEAFVQSRDQGFLHNRPEMIPSSDRKVSTAREERQQLNSIRRNNAANKLRRGLTNHIPEGATNQNKLQLQATADDLRRNMFQAPVPRKKMLQDSSDSETTSPPDRPYVQIDDVHVPQESSSYFDRIEYKNRSSKKQSQGSFLQAAQDMMNRTASRVTGTLLGSNKKGQKRQGNPIIPGQSKFTGDGLRLNLTKRNNDQSELVDTPTRKSSGKRRRGKTSSHSDDDNDYYMETNHKKKVSKGVEPTSLFVWGDPDAPKTRNSTKKQREVGATEENAIEIDDSDSDNDLMSPSPSPKKKKAETKLQKEVPLLCVGKKKVFYKGGTLTHDPETSTLTLVFDATTTQRSTRSSSIDMREVVMSWTDVDEVKYHVVGQAEPEGFTDDEADDEEEDYTLDINFFAFKVHPTKENGLQTYSSSYQPKDTKDKEKNYVLVQMVSDTDIEAMIESLRKDYHWKIFFDGTSSLIRKEVKDYGFPLVKASSRRKDNASKYEQMQGDSFRAKQTEGTILLTFPNGAGDIENNKAARRCKHASIIKEDQPDELPGPDDDYLSSRSHFLTFKLGDYDCYYQGEWLNDTCVDFWMRWISKYDKGDVQVFTSHLYSRILEEGAERVATWTANKGIDIFQKKLVFVPINNSLHWSLCVIVNPGAIKNHIERDESDMKGDLPVPFFLFFDSLRMHAKKTVEKNLLQWLNFEWQQRTQSNETPFTSKHMKMICPKVPRQNNHWDCGVFVCKYAWAMYKMRNKPFDYDSTEYTSKNPCTELITKSDEFKFGKDDIRELRDEMKTLVQRLSDTFVTWDTQLKAKTRQKKREAKRAKEAEGQGEDSGETTFTQDTHGTVETNASSDVVQIVTKADIDAKEKEEDVSVHGETESETSDYAITDRDEPESESQVVVNSENSESNEDPPNSTDLVVLSPVKSEAKKRKNLSIPDSSSHSLTRDLEAPSSQVHEGSRRNSPRNAKAEISTGSLQASHAPTFTMNKESNALGVADSEVAEAFEVEQEAPAFEGDVSPSSRKGDDTVISSSSDVVDLTKDEDEPVTGRDHADTPEVASDGFAGDSPKGSGFALNHKVNTADDAKTPDGFNKFLSNWRKDKVRKRGKYGKQKSDTPAPFRPLENETSDMDVDNDQAQAMEGIEVHDSMDVDTDGDTNDASRTNRTPDYRECNI